MHAVDFLKSPDDVELPRVIVLHGSQTFLRSEVLQKLTERMAGDTGEDVLLTRFNGPDVDLKTVSDELRTVSMWGDGRVVIVDDADQFISDFRAGLENYVAAPARKATLILLVKSWPKNTRIAKAVAKTGLDVECSELKGQALVKWVAETLQDAHGKQISRPDIAVLLELAGTDTGMLSQELDKLAAYVGERSQIGEEDIRAIVGGWTTQTAFQMLDAVIAGRLDLALSLLDKLLNAGEAPQRIFGAIAFSIRRLATGVEYSRHGMSLTAALAKAGVFRNLVDSTARFLRNTGRPHAEQFLSHLLTTDLNMKGGTRVSGRLELEQLLVRLSGRLVVSG